jgi:hypothetical protein
MSRHKIEGEEVFFTRTVKRSGWCWPRISLPQCTTSFLATCTVLGFGNIQLVLYTRARRGEMERMPHENMAFV